MEEKTRSCNRPNRHPSPSLPLVVPHLTVPALVGPAWPPGVRLHGVGHGQPGQLLKGPALIGVGAASNHGAHQESQRVHFVLGRDTALPGTHVVTVGAVSTPTSTSGVTSISPTTATRPSTPSTTVPEVTT